MATDEVTPIVSHEISWVTFKFLLLMAFFIVF